MKELLPLFRVYSSFERGTFMFVLRYQTVLKTFKYYEESIKISMAKENKGKLPFLDTEVTYFWDGTLKAIVFRKKHIPVNIYPLLHITLCPKKVSVMKTQKQKNICIKISEIKSEE